MSNARKNQLRLIEEVKNNCIKQVDLLIREIEHFQSLPITVEDEVRGKAPKKRVKTEPIQS